eukprot:CAMPEP_0184100678 /NCGR_PEP_ID=MMETSP0974-20121125/12451_1 /TAXON_ID=483370 /ORGANISM="non described non described, Strain CCMP2097" /LENGTH=368 /DNA_ID=CAMNT_0026403603 /DNA_START=45 /DNA_END=1148 /DNA_ORIENTATION=-
MAASAASRPEAPTTPRRTREPDDDAWTQQRLAAWQPQLTPQTAYSTLATVAVIFLAVGLSLRAVDEDVVFQRKVQYDGPGTSDSLSSCSVDRANAGRKCTVVVTAAHSMKAPTYVYYEVENFYQNHQRYTVSYDAEQLLGANKNKNQLTNCSPLKTNGSKVLHPCGVIANSMFNDVIVLQNPGMRMHETGLAWKSDRTQKVKQPNGFDYARTAQDVSSCILSTCNDAICDASGVHRSCKGYVCRGGDYDGGKCAAGESAVFYYTSSDDFQFLYETFPQTVSPLVGVENEHFLVWMRLAALPTFRKLYGRITDKIEDGENLEFEITNNFNVNSFNGKKYIVISTASGLGAKPKFLWAACLSVSGIAFAW